MEKLEHISSKSDKMEREKVGIIGFGKMGKLLAQQFNERYKIGIYSKGNFETKFNVFNSVESLYNFSDYLVITVPAEEISSILDEISRIDLKEDKVIFDISTFKKDFIEEYKRLPQHLKVASAHPMFGEGVDTLKDENVIVVPVDGREREAEYVESFFEEFGADVSSMKADEHDEMMKILIGIPYFFGISYLRLISDIENIEKYGGTSFELLSTYGKAVLNDSSEFIHEVIDHSEDVVEVILKDRVVDEDKIKKLQKKYDDEVGENYSKIYEFLRGD